MMYGAVDEYRLACNEERSKLDTSCMQRMSRLQAAVLLASPCLLMTVVIAPVQAI